jgi:hypothetical protein
MIPSAWLHTGILRVAKQAFDGLFWDAGLAPLAVSG